MLETEVNDILTNYSSGGHTYFYKNGEGEYHEIVELDLFRGRFITDDGDVSEFEWELEESHIYMEQIQNSIGNEEYVRKRIKDYRRYV